MSGASCAGCGDCCEAIGIGSHELHLLDYVQHMERYPGLYSAADLLDNTSSEYEGWFVATHWQPISRTEAIAIRPSVAGPGWDRRFFYRCISFDPETRRCRSHAVRPNVCRNFPYYGVAPEHNPAAPTGFARCSFWWDIPRAAWPEGTDPLPSPTPVNCC